MPKRKAKKSEDYVGYRHPPKSTQFKPGQSGNPKGRPRGTRSVGAILQDIIGRKVPVTESGRTRKLTVLEVALRRLSNDAMRGDQSAIKFLLSMVDRYGQSPEATFAFEELLAEDREILATYMPVPVNRRRRPSK